MSIIDKFVKLHIINEEDRDIYEYSIDILKTYIYFSVIILVVNYYTSNFITTMMFLSIFFSIRKYIGGVHLDKASNCMAFSILLTLIIPYVSSWFSFTPILLFFLQLVFSLFLIIMPIIDTPKKTVSKNNKRRYKKKSMYIILLCLCASIFFIYIDLINLSMIILFSIIVSYFSVLLGYIKYRNHLMTNN